MHTHKLHSHFVTIYTLRNKFFCVLWEPEGSLEFLRFFSAALGVFRHKRIFQYQYIYCLMSQLSQYNKLKFPIIHSEIKNKSIIHMLIRLRLKL